MPWGSNIILNVTSQLVSGEITIFDIRYFRIKTTTLDLFLPIREIMSFIRLLLKAYVTLMYLRITRGKNLHSKTFTKYSLKNEWKLKLHGLKLMYNKLDIFFLMMSSEMRFAIICNYLYIYIYCSIKWLPLCAFIEY